MFGIVFGALGAMAAPVPAAWQQPADVAGSGAANNATGDKATGKAGPVFKDGMAQVVPEFEKATDWVRHELWVETEFDSDGDGRNDRMHVDVTRQKQTDTEGLKVPVIYETSPYFSGIAGGNSYFWDTKHELQSSPPERPHPEPIPYRESQPVISGSQLREWVPRGFAVVHSNSPGTGQSDGCPTVGGANESLAPKAVIDWLNGRAKGFTTRDGNEEVTAFWCTGKVGMTGTSYNGTLPLAAATTGVDGLEAIIPIAPNTSYYHYYRSNGLIRHPGGYMGEDIDVLYDFINSGNPEKRDYCDCEVRDKEMAEGHDRITGDYNEFWAGRDYLNKMGQMKCALFMSHGFNDWNVMPEHSNRIYQAAKEKGLPCKVFYHQGGHGGPPPMDLMNRWFTRYVYGVENGVEEEPRAYIVRENDNPSEPTIYADYPHPDAQPVRLYPTVGGNRAGSLQFEPATMSAEESLVDDVSIRASELAKAESSEHRLLYVTAELKEAVHLSGTARVHIKLSADKPAANLSVMLVSLPIVDGAKITDNMITRGWADPQNYRSLTESEPLVPGQFYEFSFDMQPDDQVIAAGEKIGFMIFSSDHDFTLWPPAGTQLKVDLAATSIELPIVGGAKALHQAVGQ